MGLNKDIWGTHYSTRNEFQEFYCKIVDLWIVEDWEGIQNVMDDMTPAQQHDIWRHLSSTTRKGLKDHHIRLEVP